MTRTSAALRRMAVAAAVTGTATLMFAAPGHAISGGTAISNDTEPATHVVRITINEPGTGGQFGVKHHDCTGTAIARHWLVTAASCFADDPAQWRDVPAGPYDRDNIVHLAGTHSATHGVLSSSNQVEAIIPRRDRDLVLARTSEELSYGGATLATTPPTPGETLRIVGLGRTATEWIASSHQIADTTVTAVRPTDITTAGDASTCKGDAGGPAFREGTPELVAIHGPSWQRGCLGVTETRNEAIETRLDDINGWLRQHVGCDTRASNGTRVSIPDAGAAVTSPIDITGCDGTASSWTSVRVEITHTYRGDLVIDLVAPDGTSYRLKDSDSSDNADDVSETYTVNASSESANGVWTLRVQDEFSADVGTLTSWTLDL